MKILEMFFKDCCHVNFVNMSTIFLFLVLRIKFFSFEFWHVKFVNKSSHTSRNLTYIGTKFWQKSESGIVYRHVSLLT